MYYLVHEAASFVRLTTLAAFFGNLQRRDQSDHLLDFKQNAREYAST